MPISRIEVPYHRSPRTAVNAEGGDDACVRAREWQTAGLPDNAERSLVRRWGSRTLMSSRSERA
jgi:hypothetical protein